MSDPITMALTAFKAIGSMGAGLQSAIAVGSAATSFATASAAAGAQEDANNAANERARQYMLEDYDQTNLMQQQENAAASQKINQLQVDTRRTAATAQVAAGAGGVSGLSVDALLGDIYGQEASIRDSVNQNLENTGQQLSVERTGISRGFTEAANTRPAVNRPSLLGAGLQAAGGIADAYRGEIKVRGGTKKYR